MKNYKKQTGEIYNGKYIDVESKRVFNPTHDMLIKAGYEPYEPVVNTYQPTEEDKIRERMQEIRQELADTDYLAIKAFEGEDMSEHEGWKEKRKALREEFRWLEKKLPQ